MYFDLVEQGFYKLLLLLILVFLLFFWPTSPKPVGTKKLSLMILLLFFLFLIALGTLIPEG